VQLLDAASRTSFPLTENLYAYSEDLNGATWSRPNATVSSDFALAPDGTLTADKLIPSTGLNDGSVWSYSPTIAASTTYTMSYYLKSAGWNYAFVWLDRGDGNGFTVEVNLATGAARATRSNDSIYFSGLSFTNTYISNGWFRVTMTFTTGSGTPTNSQTRIYPTNVAWVSGNFGTPSVAGNGVDGIYVWGAQFNQGSVATDYLRTTAVTSPRTTTWSDLSTSRGNASLQNGAYYSPASNAMIFDGANDYASLPNLATSRNCTISFWFKHNAPGDWSDVLTFQDGSDTTPSRVEKQGGVNNYRWYNGGFVNDTLLFTHDGTQFDNITMTFSATLATCYKNGVQTAQTASSDFVTASTLRLGMRSFSANWAGSIAAFSVYNRPLTAAEVLQNFQALRGRYGV
jgi:hypothetical protein